MSREIKFRVWDLVNKEMVRVTGLDWKEGLEEISTETYVHFPYEKKTCVLMQFTGLHDRNGKKGYHKDVCRIPKDHAWALFCQKKPLNAVIEWDRGCFYLMCSIDGVERYCSIENLKHSKIIGNIFQNPELLEAK